MNLEIKSEYVFVPAPTLEKSIDLIKDRLLKRLESEDYHNTWDNGYTQSLIDVYNLLTGMESWEKE